MNNEEMKKFITQIMDNIFELSDLKNEEKIKLVIQIGIDLICNCIDLCHENHQVKVTELVVEALRKDLYLKIRK